MTGKSAFPVFFLHFLKTIMNKIADKYMSEREEGFVRRNLGKLKIILITLTAGFLLGTQIYSPNKRVIEAIVGTIVLLLLWHVSTLSALWFVLLTYPFPFGISWGNSNFIFMLIISVMLLIRVSSGEEEFHLDRTLLLPVVLLILSYIFSFNNVPLGTRIMRIGFVNTGNFLAAAVFAFLLINYINDEEKLKRAVNIIVITSVLVILFNVVELLFPGKVIVPGWLRTQHSPGIVLRGIRVKGPFNDFELNAEFFTLNSFIVFFLLVRARRMLTRFVLGSILIVDLFMMFATVTRGAFFSLIAGVIYLMFLSRKELNAVKFFGILISFVAILFILEAFVTQYTVSGSLFNRVVNTTFEKGFIPDSRSGIWEQAIERGMEHPIFGNGPGWDFVSGYSQGFWPHNLYLFYFNSLGIVGLLAFLFLMYRIVKATLPGIKASLGESSYPLALMKIFHVVILIFMLDQIKIEYLRNKIYTFFIWALFALVISTYNIIMKERKEIEKAAPS